MSVTPVAGLIEGQTLAADVAFAADVCIVGTGAGGAVAAHTLQAAGKKVLMLEEGGYYTSSRFDMHEHRAMRALYQNGALRATHDGAVAVLQGKAVGGTTVVNWTTSYRTPDLVLDQWKTKFAVNHVSRAELEPHWDAIEKRLNIAAWPLAKANRNNRTLWDGCTALGYEVHEIHRNVKACGDTGYCGLGCPLDAKQSMLVSYVPDAMDAGATVVSRCRADRLVITNGEVTGLEASLLEADGKTPTGVKLTVTAKTFILAAGAIGSSALLLRSGAPDPHQRLGIRTFLHPVAVSVGEYEEPINGTRGAPQTVASRHFYDRGEEVGFLIEAAPLFPGLTAAALPGFGAVHAASMQKLDHLTLHLVLTADGLHDDVPGGTVTVRDDGTPKLTYNLAERTLRAFQFGQKELARVQFASGAKAVHTLHDPTVRMANAGEIGKIDTLPFKPHKLAVFSAHVMGGCGMSDEEKLGVVRSEDLRHHQVKNLHVIDGSVFPTSLGVNPQETIYGLARLIATRLA